MKVIVAGGREFVNQKIGFSAIERSLTQQLEKEKEKLEIVCGGARGADAIGKQWGEKNNLSVVMFPADWKTHGKSAGYKRNAQMAEYADALIAFWDGNSRGTKHMIDLANKHGIVIRVFDYNGMIIKN